MAACTKDYWVHPNKSSADFQQDQVQCGSYANIKAMNDFPATPPSYNYNAYSGKVIPAQGIDFSALGRPAAIINNTRSCMKSLGWQKISKKQFNQYQQGGQ